MKKGLMVLAAMFGCLSVFATPQITDVKAEPVSPWGRGVAITYTLSEDAPYGCGIEVTASNRNTKVVYSVKSLWGDVSLKGGTHRVWWDLVADNVFLMDESVDFSVVLLEPVQLWEYGPYFAQCNIGAIKPEEVGYYFWWGDTVGYKWVESRFDAVDGSVTGFSFESGNCPTYGLDDSTLKSKGYITSAGVLADKYDAAKRHWGSKWRMPTNEEIEGLVNNCDATWTTRNGVSGLLVMGRREYATKSIFIPAVGYGKGSFLYESTSRGYYWSSGIYPDRSYHARSLLFHSGGSTSGVGYLRYFAFPVRPVAGCAK